MTESHMEFDFDAYFRRFEQFILKLADQLMVLAKKLFRRAQLQRMQEGDNATPSERQATDATLTPRQRRAAARMA